LIWTGCSSNGSPTSESSLNSNSKLIKKRTLGEKIKALKSIISLANTSPQCKYLFDKEYKTYILMVAEIVACATF
jgi:hypothetical protein